MRLSIFLSLCFLTVTGVSQDINYARTILDTLCSPYFDGRGYYNDGEKRAAEFISNEYEKIGLKPVDGSYCQPFTLSANSIQGELKLTMGKTKLEPGKDFLVDPSSPPYSGESNVIVLKDNQLTDIEAFKKAIPSFQSKFVVVDMTMVKEESKEIKGQANDILMFLTYSTEVKLAGVIELTGEKLTYTASQYKAERPHLIVSKDKAPDKIKEINLKVESKFVTDYQSQNVVGLLEGAVKDTFIYVVGHYDHLGRMGDSLYFPGANDNASGVAMILSLAKEFAQEEELNYSIVFICFGSEEIGLVGSKYYTENPLLPLEQIKFLINLDILGTGDDGIQVVNGKIHEKDFENLVALNEDKKLLKQVKIRGKACNSDHCFFSEKGVPGFFIYTLGGIAHYHNIYDQSATLPLTEFEDLFVLLKAFILEM
jgi:hypothetical protein